MNIKSLLLGSAAVLVAATGARAADAIVIAEPEPVEYVRVCDTYGAGYFYIPGTETCMRIHGYVRGVVSAGDNVYARTRYGHAKEYFSPLGVDPAGLITTNPANANRPTGRHLSIGPVGAPINGYDGIDNDTYDWMTRAHLRFSTATETELGTLRSYIDMRSQWSDGVDSANGTIRNAWIELGGFRMGMGDTSFVTWTNGYGTVYNDDINTPMGKRTNFISYTFSADNGFSAMIGLEQGNNGADNNDTSYRDPITGILGSTILSSNGARGGFYGFARSATVLPNTTHLRLDPGANVYARNHELSAKIDDYVPNVVGGVKYEQGWGGVSAVVAYDAFYEEWAGKIRLDVNATDDLSLFLMAGYKSHDDYYRIDESYGTTNGVTPGFNHLNNTFGVYRAHSTIYGDWGGDWALWGGGQYRFNEDRTAFNLQLSYDDTRTFAAVANVEHEIVSGLSIIAEVNYVSWDDKVGFGALAGVPAGTNVPTADTGVRSSLRGEDAFGGLIVLQRSF